MNKVKNIVLTPARSFLESFKESRKDVIFTVIAGILTVLVFFIPTGFEGSGAHIRQNSVRVKARVIEVNNEMLRMIGPVYNGWQQLQVQVLSGRFKGEIHPSFNNMLGRMEMDKIFTEGDIAFAVINLSEDGLAAHVQVMDHYRTDKIIVLAALFILATVIIMGWMGIKILITFIFSAVMLIRILYPMTLRGFDPIIGALIITILIAALTLFLVGGLSRRALSAFLGTVGGVAFTAILSFAFTGWFNIHGAVRPFAEQLIYAGFGHINLAHLFIAGIFIAASGAMVDLAMNVAAAMDEIREQQPAITRTQLMRSGFHIARQSAGTMATTLLLAYSAENTAIIMTFIAGGFPFENILNMVWVSSEIVHTLVGCFGLTLVAPLTVLTGGILLGRPCATSVVDIKN